MKDYQATFINDDDRLIYRLMAHDLRDAITAASYLCPTGYKLGRVLEVPEW